MSTQLTLSQVANFLNVSEKSIRRYIKAGRLSAELIKGKKGNEYRIKKQSLKDFTKPPRGKRSHKTRDYAKKEKKENKIKKTEKQKIKQEKHDDLVPLRKVIEENVEKFASSSQNQGSIIDYKVLYNKLLYKYEQSLIMIGSLEAQLSSKTKAPDYNEKVKKLEEKATRQEELIWELYQIINHKEEH